MSIDWMRNSVLRVWLIDCDEYDENELFVYRDDDWDDEVESELSENKTEIWLEQRLWRRKDRDWAGMKSIEIDLILIDRRIYLCVWCNICRERENKRISAQRHDTSSVIVSVRLNCYLWKRFEDKIEQDWNLSMKMSRFEKSPFRNIYVWRRDDWKKENDKNSNDCNHSIEYMNIVVCISLSCEMMTETTEYLLSTAIEIDVCCPNVKIWIWR